MGGNLHSNRPERYFGHPLKNRDKKDKARTTNTSATAEEKDDAPIILLHYADAEEKEEENDYSNAYGNWIHGLTIVSYKILVNGAVYRREYSYYTLGMPGENAIDPLRRQEIRRFTRSGYDTLQERKKTASRIREQRSVRSKNKQSISERQTGIASIREGLAHEAGLTAELEEVRQELTDQSTSLVKRSIALFRPSRTRTLQERSHVLQRELEPLSNTHDFNEYKYQQLQRELERFEQIRSKLPDGRVLLDNFYDTNGRLMDIYRERGRKQKERDAYAREHGTISEIVRNHGVYLVHATHPNIDEGQNNRFLRKGVTWQDKVAVILDRKPTISGSTVRPGSKALTWSSIGLVLRKGVVEDAYKDDIGTKTESRTTKRSAFIRSEGVEGYKRDLIDAIYGSQRYNELIIGDDPEVAGMFINLDGVVLDTQILRTNRSPYDLTRFHIGGGKDMSFREVFDGASDFGMDVFLFENGTAYRGALDESRGTLLKGQNVTPQEMLQVAYTVPPDKQWSVQQRARNSLTLEALVR